jgi:hypothetical protein
MSEFKQWLEEQIGALKQEHEKGSENQLILQGRYEAATIILSKFELLQGVEATPISKPKKSRKKSSTSAS